MEKKCFISSYTSWYISSLYSVLSTLDFTSIYSVLLIISLTTIFISSISNFNLRDLALL